MTTDQQPAALPAVRTIGQEEPWLWLAAGWRDMQQAPAVGLSYGLIVSLAGALMTAGLFYLDALPLMLPVIAAFMLIGPILAVGLYETSRRLEAGEPVKVRDVFIVAVRSPMQMAYIGLVLMFALLAWARIATLLFALFFGTMDYPPLEQWVSVLIFTGEGLAFLAVGTVTGGVLAFLVFAISVMSLPLLMVRDMDVISAVVVSVRAVKANPVPMLLWAWLIALLSIVGMVTLFVGLILIFPLLGHAAWHAFRAVVVE